MTHKKYWRWLEAPQRNLITPYGRFDLLEIDPVSELPIKEYKPNYKNNFEKKTIEPAKTNIENPTDKLDTSLSVVEWMREKKNFILDFIAAALSFFSPAASNFIQQLKTTETKNILANKQGSGNMDGTTKEFIVGFITRWILKIGGGFLLSVGITAGSVTEIVGAVVAILIGLAVSLFQQKKALETDLKTIQKR